MIVRKKLLVHFHSSYQELLGECTERIERFTSAMGTCRGLFPRNILNPFAINMILKYNRTDIKTYYSG